MQSPFNSIAKTTAWTILCVLAMFAPRYLWQETAWSSLPQYDGPIWAAGVVLAGCLLSILARRHAHVVMLALVIGWLGLGVGIDNLVVVGLWIASAWTLGGLLLDRIHRAPDGYALRHPLEAIILGAAIWVAVFNVMLHYRINYRGVYWGLSLIALAPSFRFSRFQYQQAFNTRARLANEWMASIPLWAWVLGLAVIGWVLRWSSFPSLMVDDYATHLRMWTNFLTKHRAELDPVNQIWAFAPFASDLVHATLSLMAGDDIRGAWNLGLAMALLTLTANVLQQARVSVQWQWLLVVLLASTPMLGNLLLSLQTELVLAVIAMASTVLICGAVKGSNVHAWGVLAGAALCAAIKLPAAALGVFLIVALVLRTGLSSLVPRRQNALCALVTLLMLAWVALHNYAMAWLATGNPVFPLYNGIFRSPLFSPENFIDSTWTTGFSFHSYFDAFFETSRYFESADYVAGWQYLILLPCALIALILGKNSRPLRPLLLPTLGFGILMFATIQYWRYLFPIMPLAIAAMGSLFVGKQRALQFLFAATALVCISLNLYAFRGISWMMQSPAQVAYTEQGRNQLVTAYAPAAQLNKIVNRISPEARVLYPMETPFGATLHGVPLYVNWYSPKRHADFLAIKSIQDATDFLTTVRADFVIISQVNTASGPTPTAFLREQLARYGRVVGQSGPLTLFQTGTSLINYHEGFSLRYAVTASGPSINRNSTLPIEATTQPQLFEWFATGAANQARYTVRLRCDNDKGYFIAQVNWDSGAPYYRLISCRSESFTFSEAIPVPASARQGQPYITVRDRASAVVEDLHVELN
ncbi:hypothetical protein [Achromobacter xylosoxidans]|uniref:hypothetical protein n=1 Tax=Alcaligenes xylosoxydans xylosoxydans TaxID=85698 RepID=UPI001EEC9DAD|nr:hypothetical protein [Achromobacter xylosoxidans]